MASELTPFLNKTIAMGLRIARKKTAYFRTMNYDYSDQAAQLNDGIRVPIAAAQTAVAVSPSSAPYAAPDTTNTSVTVPLDQHYHTAFKLEDKERRQMDADNNFIPLQLDAAITALLENMNAYAAGLYKGVYGFAGTAGTTPFASNTDAAKLLRAELNRQKCPAQNRFAMLDIDADANASNLSAFQDASKSADPRVVMEGEIGRKMGFGWNWDHDVPTHTTVAAGTPLVDGGSQTGTTLVVDGFTTAPAEGDVFTIAGDTQTYVVASATTLSSTESTLTISPAIASAPADNAAVTFKATHVVNMGYHQEAFAFAIRPLSVDAIDRAVGEFAVMTDPLTGLSLRLEVVRQNKQTMWDLDVLYGGKLIRPEYACRLAG